MVGAILSLFNVGLFVLMPFTGVYSDFVNKQKLTRNAYLIMGIGTVMFALKADLRLDLLIAVILNQLMYGFAVGFEMPLRLVWLRDIITDEEHITSAIGMNQLAGNGSRILGPLLAGFITQITVLEVCYYSNIAFTGVAFLLIVFMKKPTEDIQRGKIKRLDITQGLKLGFQFVNRSKELKRLVYLSLAVSFTVFAYAALMPDYISNYLDGGSDDLGRIMACSGVGALCASLFFSTQKNLPSLHKFILISIVTYLLMYFLLFSFQSVILTYVLMFIMGVAQVMYYASCQNTIHRVVPKEYLGRVISIFLMGNMGCFTLGNMIIGKLADHFGVVYGFLFSLSGCLFSLILFGLFRGKLKYLMTNKISYS
jgi:MFS family permease